MKERYLTALTSLLLFLALAVFFVYVPVLPMIVIALILIGTVVMFLLGVYCGITVDLKQWRHGDPDLRGGPDW
jgi:hypothetical protein